MKRFLPRLFAGCLALTLSWAMAADGVTKNQILIGQNITLQGGKNDYGVAVQEGIQTYLNAINGRGGVNGRQVVLKTLDDDNKGNLAEANARQLVEQDKVFILFGSIEGGPSTAVMKAAIDLKVPFFGPIAGSPTLRRPFQPLVFPVRAEHREEFRALLAYGKSIGATRVGFMRADSETGATASGQRETAVPGTRHGAGGRLALQVRHGRRPDRPDGRPTGKRQGPDRVQPRLTRRV
jgi:branched-chain amino acid transport system substrate-binding protein